MTLGNSNNSHLNYTNMKNNNYWNDVAKYGALLGVLMGSSKILEQSMILSGNLTYMMLTMVEWLLFAVIFCLILIKAAKNRASKVAPELGFSYGQGISYMILVSLFAAIPVTFLFYIYQNSIVGYDNYIAKLIQSMTQLIEPYKNMLDNNMLAQYEENVRIIKEQPKLSIFEMLYSTMLSYAFLGGIVGVIFAGLARRKPQIFEGEETK